MLFEPHKHEDLIGRYWVEDKTGTPFELLGIVYGKDDWYWLMGNEWGGYQWLSCVGSIENFGFTPEEK